MTTSELYQAALKAEPYQTATHTLPNGDTLFCSVKVVAGRSITRKHFRTNWFLKRAAEQYSKAISRNTAVQLLA